MQPQTQSTFFRKLPIEIRSQIQTAYLCSYLHIAAIYENELGCNMSPQFHDRLEKAYYFLTPPSPLSTTCKRMYKEMRQDTGLVDARGLAVLAVAPELLNGMGLRMGLAVEGHFVWDRLRRLVFINELDYPTESAWPPLLAQVLQLAPQLTTLELEWSPRMTVTRTNPGMDALVKVSEHPTIRTIRVRGNVPRSWLKELATMPGKEIVVEPLLWEDRDPEEDKLVDQRRMESLEHQTARIHRFYEEQKGNHVKIPKKETTPPCTIL